MAEDVETMLRQHRAALAGEATLEEGQDPTGRLASSVRHLHRDVGRLERLVGQLQEGAEATGADVLRRLRRIEGRLATTEAEDHRVKLAQAILEQGEAHHRALRGRMDVLLGRKRGLFWSEATERIDRERARQEAVHGYDDAHDDAEHSRGELALAGAGIAAVDRWDFGLYGWAGDMVHEHRPASRIRRLEIAGALIAAELDRELRREARQAPTEGHRKGAGVDPQGDDTDAFTTAQGEEV